LVISGWQDNGTNLVRDGNWRRVIGGDGMECIIDYTDENIMYGALYYGNVRRSTNGGNNFNTIVGSGDNNGVNSSGLWVTPYILHPKDPATLLIGKDELYRSENYGDTWEQLGSIGGAGQIRVITYAPSNPDIIYVARTNTLSVSIDGGQTFQIISQGLPNLTITAITVSNIDPNRVYVSFSGYNPEEKIYLSTNRGSTWSNYTSGIPNLPVNYVLYSHGSANGIYAATDVGVYYRDETLQSWTVFSEGIPNVVVTELEIHYPTSKIRAATYGRGQWESDLYGGAPSPPVADFFVNATSACSGSSISISNLSQNGVYDWKWSFEGNPTGDVTAFNPSLVWDEAGTYKVELIIFNPAGSDTLSQEIIVKPTPVLTFDPPNPIVCAGDEISITASGATSFLWNLGLGPGAVKTFAPTQTRTYTVTGNNTGCLNTATLTVTVVDKPTISAEASASELCEGESVEITVDGAPIYEWLNGSGTGPLLEVTPMVGNAFFVVGINEDGCRDTVQLDVLVNPLPALMVTPASLVICEGETVILTAEGGDSYQWSNGLGNDPVITVQPNESVVYEVTAFTDKNCQASITVPIEVNLIPDVQLVSSHSIICKGEFIQLQASGADQYTWDGQPNASEIEVVADESRLYSVVGTSNKGCSKEATVFVEVIALEASLRSWPDPNCNSGYYQLNIGPETNVTGYNIPPSWSIDLNGIPGVWQINQIGAGTVTISLENTQGQCDIKLTLLEGPIIPEQNLVYTSCASSLSITDECSNGEGRWYVVNKSDGLVSQIILSEDGNLPDVTEENLVQNYYFFQCQNGCETFVGPGIDVLSGTQPCDPAGPGDLIFGFRLVPNPASDLFTIQIQHPLQDRIEVKIVDVIGRKVFEGYYNHEGGLMQIPVETKNWQSGTFVVSVFDSTGKRLQEKLIIH
jgi:PKD repeat protein